MKNPSPRNPKSERNPMAEIRRARPQDFWLRASDFGLLSAFGFRLSDFTLP